MRAAARRGALHWVLGLLAVTGVADTTQAQSAYPEREIKIVVGFTAGGTTDIIARIVGQELTVRWGKAVIIENRPGAGGNIGADIVAKAKPDGHTLLIGSVGPMAVNASLYKDIPYDNLKDLQPVTLIAHVPNMLVVNPAMNPAANLKDFIDGAKARPGSVFYGSTGSGTMSHLVGEMLKQMAAIDITHVPYKGATGVTDMLGGQAICCMFATIPSVIQHVRSGRLKALAVSSAKRSRSAPDVPTIAESGFAGFDGSSWFGMAAPAGTPRDVVLKLQKEVASIIGVPAIAEKLIQQGADPVGDTPEEFAAYIKSETEKWGRVVKAGNIMAE